MDVGVIIAAIPLAASAVVLGVIVAWLSMDALEMKERVK